MEDDEDEDDDPDGSGLRMLCFAAGVLWLWQAFLHLPKLQWMKALTTKYGYVWPCMATVCARVKIR